MNTSEQINEIATALAKAQGEMENASKNAANSHFRNKYADLAEVLNVVRPTLSKHGIAIAQVSSVQDGVMLLHTRLVHTSGQWIESVHPIAALPEKPQAIGAAETYARRYSLAAICGISQEDDDLADGKNAPKAAAPAPKQPDTKAIEESAKVHDMLISAIETAQSIDELDEWRTLDSTKAAARKLTPEHSQSIKAAVDEKRASLPPRVMRETEAA